MRIVSFGLYLFLVILAAGCSKGKQEAIRKTDLPLASEASTDNTNSISDLNLYSDNFPDGAMIPVEFTCDGEDKSPSLHWSEAPTETKSFALICDDPDAPGSKWVHWVAYDIPATTTTLKQAVDDLPVMDDGSKQGKNSFDRIGYGGPCPPVGAPHHYYFKVYALDFFTDLPAGATKMELLNVMKGHVLARGQLVGKYKRQSNK